MDLTRDFSTISLHDLPEVGGKNASLGEMIAHLSDLGIKVPRGFTTTARAYREFLKENHLENKIYSKLATLDVDNVKRLQEVSSAIRDSIMQASLPTSLEDAVKVAYQNLKLKSDQTVAVRSSATAEDLPEASFAGQQETVLNVSGIDNVLDTIKRVYASLFTDRAITYRVLHNFKHEDVAISVGIQQMVRSDLASSGVVFTLDTESGFKNVIFITASYGLGELVVQGAINPDEFFVHKPTLKAGKQSIISRTLGSKAEKLTYAESNNERVKKMAVNPTEQARFCLNDEEILILAKQALIIEEHYEKPMDIEWAKDGVDGEIYIVQARPETVKATETHQCIERYILNKKVEPIISGRSIGEKIGKGIARIIETPNRMDLFKKGEILVADMTDPDWEPIMKNAAAIITNRGGRTCHAAIIAREMGIPAIVGCTNATEIIKSDEGVTVSCAEGETGYVYPGLLDYDIEKTEIEQLPDIPIKLSMNLANPEQAFANQFLPNHGIGLARLEFIIGNMIGIHPNAILELENLSDRLKEKIKKKTAAYASPLEFYIEKLAEGIATLSGAFYPKPVIVRFSDFKTNEYANLLGGKNFEPKEENPMIGYRGASRYISGNFKPCFALECEAIKRVREKKGLTNTHVMFPFVRTLEEAKQLIEITKANGLVRGKEGLNFYMMCEIPSNALLVEEFLNYFDGYSIGSNDLTQLTLGLDRDSSLVANLFDERDPAVKTLLHEVIRICRRLNKYVGICGQGPSDHIDLAQWLMKEGIESLSLSPDSILPTWLALAKEN